jgi:hypothetical protein
VVQEQIISEEATKPVTGRRNVARLRLYLPGRIKTLEGEFSCFVECLSQTGARIIIPDAGKVGQCGILRCGDLNMFFTRVWSEDNRAGLAFDEHVAAETLHELRRINDNFDDIQRAEIRHMAHEWVMGLGD